MTNVAAIAPALLKMHDERSAVLMLTWTTLTLMIQQRTCVDDVFVVVDDVDVALSIDLMKLKSAVVDVDWPINLNCHVNLNWTWND